MPRVFCRDVAMDSLYLLLPLSLVLVFLIGVELTRQGVVDLWWR